jgi:hypothetical protein
VPELESLSYPSGAAEWFDDMADAMLLLGEGTFQFTKALKSLGCQPFATSTNSLSPGGAVAGALLHVDATRLHFNQQVSWLVRKHNLSRFAWNFPFTGTEEDAYEQEVLILKTLQSLIVLFADALPLEDKSSSSVTVMLGLTLQGDQFSRWNVTRSAWRTGWRLTGWCPFDHNEFPGYHPCRENGKKFPVDKARLYVLKREISCCEI